MLVGGGERKIVRTLGDGRIRSGVGIWRRETWYPSACGFTEGGLALALE